MVRVLPDAPCPDVLLSVRSPGALEKGGVEGQIGERDQLAPVPEVESYAERNAMVDA